MVDRWTRFILLAFGLMTPALAAGQEAVPEKLTAKGVEFFESKIRPVLLQHCYSCHSAKSDEPKGGLLLDSRDALRKGGESGSAVVPGNISESLLIQAIRYESVEMPPKEKLPDSVIADFEEWVRMGAPDPRTGAATTKKLSLAEARSFWSFRKPTMPAIPSVQQSNWARTDIDRFVQATWEAKGLSIGKDADRSVLARRIYFDLIGLPPSPEQIDRFVTDTSPRAVESLIDELLQSPQFGERWGRHWLDVARFGESTGKERNIPMPYAWRYRDYVIDSFNKDKPYDRFVREQIAGDLLQAKSTEEYNENLTATGFLAIGPKSLNERNREQYMMDVADEQIDVSCRVVLGMTVACARCHDHKFDPVSTADYYAMAGIFRSTEVLAGLKPGNNKGGYAGSFAMLADGTPKAKHTQEELDQIKQLTNDIQDAKASRARLVNLAAAKAKGKGSEPAKKLKETTTKLNARIERLEGQLESLKDKKPEGTTPVMAVTDASNPANCRINIRGEVNDLGDEVPRGVPVVLSFDRTAKFNTENSGRAQLASWLVGKDNPLTARVMANRVWAHLFGRGIVESVDNFGTLGDSPTHPELLDYLAIRYMDLNWSTKSLIKEIMLSRAYQMSSDHNAANYAKDPGNKYLWRMNRRRLEAEIIRDSILAVSGQLDLKRPDGSLVKDSAGVEIGRRKTAEPNYDSLTNRSVYLPYIRNGIPEMLAVFDAADPSLSVGQREVTTVATQALFLMNSPFVMDQATHAAKRVLYEAGASDEERVNYAFRLILGRSPTVEQTKSALELLKQPSGGSTTAESRSAAYAALCQMLMASGEFRYVY